MRTLATSFALMALAACDTQGSEDGPAQRIALDHGRLPAAIQPPAPSLETEGAVWTVNEDGQSIHFGKPNEEPLMSLACRLKENPPRLAVIRHAPARPGQEALFPVIGNGMRSRFLVDAALRDGEWRWEGTLPADDSKLDVFTGTREIRATLPGAGTLEIEGSRVPGEFVTWCRAGERVMETAEEEREEAAEDSGESRVS